MEERITMQEKRRSKRMPIDLFLDISSLFKQDNVKVLDVHAPIEVNNISKKGIGFKTNSILPMGYYFNAKLQLGSNESILYCVVRILREKELSDGYREYGCEFIGMPPILDFIFDEYEQSLSKDENKL